MDSKNIIEYIETLSDEEKQKVQNYMFESMMADRRDDMQRAVNGRMLATNRRVRSDVLLKFYQEKAGKGKCLSESQLQELKETWSDIWKLNIVDKEWVEIFTEHTGEFSPEYVGANLHYYFTEYEKIDYEYLRAFLDKNYMDVVLGDVKYPPVLIRKIHGLYLDADFNKIDLEKAVDIIYENRETECVVKVSRISSGGKGVYFVDEKFTRDDVEELLALDPDLAVQKVIKQHHKMQEMNPSSINTIRIMTIMLDDESIVLSSVMRIGGENSRVDNFSSGGVACGIKEDGSLKDFGYTQEGKRLVRHPNGFEFENGFVPNFDKVIDLVKRLHYRVPVFGVISWDIAVDEEGEPMLIEYNVSQGQIDIHQYNNGPIYGKYRKRIIEDVFSRYKRKNANLDFSYWADMEGLANITDVSRETINLVIPNLINNFKIKTLNGAAFYKNDNLRTAVIEADIDEIEPYTFMRCSVLETVDIAGSVKKVSEKAFADCPELVSVSLPASVEKIDNTAFNDCPNLCLICDEDSYVQKFAEENNIRYMLK